MTIKKYIRDHPERDVINGIEFCLFGVNYDEELDIEEKTLFDNDTEKDEYYSFLERLEKAKEELEQDTKGKTYEEAKEYYKNLTEDGNQYYWGGMIWVSTKGIDKDDCIYYGVRMD